jgi:hypothetical protein
MNPLFAVAESGMIVRYDPSVVADPESIFEKMNRREFKTIKGFHTVNLYNEPNLGGKINANWNTTVTNNSICTWGYLPKLPFNTTFELMEFSGEVRLVPSFARPDRNLNNPSVIQSNLFWDPVKAMEHDQTKEIKILFASNVDRVSNESHQVVNYLIFQLFDKSSNQLIGNFLPPIPNIFNDGKICMGRYFVGITRSNSDTLGKIVQDSIDSFYSSSANEDLITDSMNRREISSQLFGWNSSKETSYSMGNIERLLKVRVGNFLLDNLPYEN